MKKRIILPLLLLAATLHAQQPPPPPPPPDDGGGRIPGGNIDLNDIPVPAEDKKLLPELTEAELKAMPVQVSVIPVGEVPPPIVFKGESGLGEETFRKPLEYPPSVYHIATANGTVKIPAGQNQMVAPTAVPRRGEFQLSYEVPPDIEAVPGREKAPPLQNMGTFAVPAGATHLAIVVWKEASAKLWTSPKFQVIDISPAKVKSNEAIVINGSGKEMAIHRGDAPYKIRPGFMGKVALPVNAAGQVPMVVAAASGVGWQQLSRTVLGTSKDERIFVIAWPVPRNPARPSGVAMQAMAKRLPDAKPFEAPGS